MKFKNIGSTNVVVFALLELWFFPAYCAVAITAIRGLIFTWWISKLFADFKIRVRFLHPDGSGGLGAIGTYAAKTGYIIGLWGFIIVVVILTEIRLLTGQFGDLYFGPAILFPLIAYLLAAPLAFFAPMWNAHLSMKRARDVLLQEIDNDFSRDALELAETELYDADELKTRVERMEHLETLHEMISKAPVWPFSIPNVVSYFARIYIPVILPLLPSFAEVVSTALR